MRKFMMLVAATLLLAPNTAFSASDCYSCEEESRTGGAAGV